MPEPTACCPQGDCDIKYIDPTYMIRAIPTTTNDRVYCKVLGQGAVHGAFGGERVYVSLGCCCVLVLCSMLVAF
jgi:6-phosphofructokinase